MLLSLLGMLNYPGSAAGCTIIWADGSVNQISLPVGQSGLKRRRGFLYLQRDSEVVGNVARPSTPSFQSRLESSRIAGDQDEVSREPPSLGSGPSAEGPE